MATYKRPEAKVLLVATRNGYTGERKHGALRPQKPLRLIRDGEVGVSGILYLTPTRYNVTTRMILHEGGQLCEPF